jgi:hypothetical protein
MTSNSTLSSAAKLDDVAHRMSGQDVGMKFYVPSFRHCAGALQNGVEAARSCSSFFSDFLDKFWHIIDLFNRHHVKLGAVLLRDRKRERQGVKGVLRSVIGMKDSIKHERLRDYSALAGIRRSGVTSAF